MNKSIITIAKSSLAAIAAAIGCRGCEDRAASELDPTYRAGEIPTPEAGEWIVCENGHRVAQAEKSIFVGMPWDLAIGNWQVDEPKVGTQFSDCLCSKCGGCFIHLVPGSEDPVHLVTEKYYKEHGWPYHEKDM